MDYVYVKPKDITWQEAEKFLGLRVDRRKKYFFWDQQPYESTDWAPTYKVYELAKWVQHCVGCTEFGEYNQYYDDYQTDLKSGAKIGCGCEWCGYTGKSRMVELVPTHGLAFEKELRENP